MDPNQTDLEVGQKSKPGTSLAKKDDGNQQLPWSECRLPLYRAALRGDWEAAKEIHKRHPDCFTKSVSKHGDSALHFASAGGHANFVKRLLSQAQLTHKDLELRNNAGNNAYCLAAGSGSVEIAEEFEKYHPELRNMAGSDGFKPIRLAAFLGQQKMVIHLMDCFHLLSDQERVDLFITTITTDLYEVALDILGKDEKLAIARNGNGETALHVMARKTRKKEQQEEQLKIGLVERLWKIIIKQSDEEISSILSSPQPRLLFVATELGNYEFVATLVRHYPDLIWEFDEDCQNIFHYAVKYRQEKIFSHIRQIEGAKNFLSIYGNNILYLAAILPSSDKLNVVSGAALQMQRELLWFQAVEDIVRCDYANLRDNPTLSNEGKSIGLETPRASFCREHRSLREEGEKWMRETATSCMVVATLVAAVVFGAIFQPPSKDNENMFWMFVVFLAASLLASTASILTFLTILTSRYTEEDFLVSLPVKLMVGLTSLVFSIMTMLLSFTMTVAIVFPHRSLWVVITVLVWIIGTFFIWQQFPLLIDVHRSTFGSTYVFRPKQELFWD